MECSQVSFGSVQIYWDYESAATHIQSPDFWVHAVLPENSHLLFLQQDILEGMKKWDDLWEDIGNVSSSVAE